MYLSLAETLSIGIPVLHIEPVDRCWHATPDLFPNWQNSVQIATLQMIGHVLLSTNFNTLQPRLQTLSTGWHTLASSSRQGKQFLLIGRQYLALFYSMKQREFLLFLINRNCVPWVGGSIPSRGGEIF